MSTIAYLVVLDSSHGATEIDTLTALRMVRGVVSVEPATDDATVQAAKAHLRRSAARHGFEALMEALKCGG